MCHYLGINVDTSWFAYRILQRYPNNFCIAYTPYGMCEKTIEASRCVHEECAMGFFPFLFIDMLEVPTSHSLSCPFDSSFPVMSSLYISSYCMDATTCCGLGLLEFVLSLSPPFVLWTASTLEGCGWLPVVEGLWPCALSCESISISVVFEAAYSSSKNSSSASAVSCGDLWLLHVFRVVWLGGPIFGGAIFDSSWFLS
jgi:hypothetical protein